MNKTLNLGCGERTFKEYPEGYTCVNYDERELPVVDVVGNVKDLSQFADGEFSYILASDIIEHFPIKEIPTLLHGWARVLSVGGIIEIRTPNLAWALQHYTNNKDAEFVSYHIFGGQDYSGNFHYVMFDAFWLAKVCQSCGLSPIDCTEEGSNIIFKASKVGGQYI